MSKSEPVASVEPFPVAEYVRDELEARGWSHAEAVANLPGDAAVNELWLRFMSCPELWTSRSIEFTAEDAARLWLIFGVSAATWSRLHESYLLVKGSKGSI